MGFRLKWEVSADHKSQPINEKVEYNMDDIKEMILEAVNHIKKKK